MNLSEMAAGIACGPSIPTQGEIAPILCVLERLIEADVPLGALKFWKFHVYFPSNALLQQGLPMISGIVDELVDMEHICDSFVTCGCV